jgi:hypothetical protein
VAAAQVKFVSLYVLGSPFCEPPRLLLGKPFEKAVRPPAMRVRLAVEIHPSRLHQNSLSTVELRLRRLAAELSRGSVRHRPDTNRPSTASAPSFAPIAIGSVSVSASRLAARVDRTVSCPSPPRRDARFSIIPGPRSLAASTVNGLSGRSGRIAMVFTGAVPDGRKNVLAPKMTAINPTAAIAHAAKRRRGAD